MKMLQKGFGKNVQVGAFGVAAVIQFLDVLDKVMTIWFEN